MSPGPNSMSQWIKACALLTLFGALPDGTASAGDLVLHNRSAKIFALHASKDGLLIVGQARKVIASVLPRQGELAVSISTTHAVGLPKFHVDNHYAQAVTFKVAAVEGTKLLSTFDFCGHVATDSWIVLPATTTDVHLSRFAEVGKDCP